MLHSYINFEQLHNLKCNLHWIFSCT